MSEQYKKTTVLETLRELYIQKFKIIAIVFFVSLIVAIVSLFVPNEYKSSANLLPNPNRGLGFDIFSENGGIQSLASTFLGGQSNEANRFYIILESYSTRASVVEKFDLIDVYETSESKTPLNDAIEIFTDNLNLESKEEGNFIIEFWDKDPVRAQEITSYLVEMLSSRNTEISSKEATLYLEFVGKRHEESISVLDSLTTELETFQSKYGVLELPTQLENYFGLLATLSANKYSTEIKLNLLKTTTPENSIQYQNAMLELEAINSKLNDAYKDTSSNTLELNFSQIPGISKEYFTILGEIEIQTEILKFITPLFEQAKMDQLKSLPIVSVVDNPIVPQEKSRPKRTLIVLLASMSTFIITVSYFLIMLSLRNNKHILSSITEKP